MPRWYKIPVVRQIGHAAIYYPIRAIIGVFSCLPRPVLGPGCKALAGLARILDRKHTRIAIHNLERAFPEKNAEQLRAIVRGLYRHFGLMIQDSVLLWRSRNEDILAKFLDSPDLSRIHQIEREGKGLILITGHMGNWEMAGNALSTVFPVNSLSREFRNPMIRRRMIRFRTAFGQKVIFAKRGFDPMLDCLARNECLALLPDKQLKTSRVTVKFFGRLVKAPSSPAILSFRSGAPILTGAAFRIGDASRFHLESGDLIRPDRSAVKGAEIRRMTQAYMTSLENLIRRHPEQWIWMHNRWKKATAVSDVPSAPAQTVIQEAK